MRLEQAREQAARRSQEILEKARSRAREEHEQTLQRAQKEDREFFRKHEEQLDRAAEAVVRIIIAPQWS